MGARKGRRSRSLGEVLKNIAENAPDVRSVADLSMADRAGKRKRGAYFSSNTYSC